MLDSPSCPYTDYMNMQIKSIFDGDLLRFSGYSGFDLYTLRSFNLPAVL